MSVVVFACWSAGRGATLRILRRTSPIWLGGISGDIRLRYALISLSGVSHPSMCRAALTLAVVDPIATVGLLS
jgi:hypothetical protein